MSKTYTILRKRTIIQFITEQYSANSEVEAVEMAEKDQNEGNPSDWCDTKGDIEYSTVTEDDILEVEDE